MSCDHKTATNRFTFYTKNVETWKWKTRKRHLLPLKVHRRAETFFILHPWRFTNICDLWIDGVQVRHTRGHGQNIHESRRNERGVTQTGGCLLSLRNVWIWPGDKRKLGEEKSCWFSDGRVFEGTSTSTAPRVPPTFTLIPTRTWARLWYLGCSKWTFLGRPDCIHT